MKLDEWVARAQARLISAGIEAGRLEAQVLAAYALGRDRSWVLAHGNDNVVARRLESPLARRAAGEPLAYILGTREFYGRPFVVDRRVLIPRHETETVVDTTLAEIRSRAPECRVLDVGLGSGCIAITVSLETRAKVCGSEVSFDALEVALENARRLEASVDMRQSDLFSAFRGEHFDVIVSNPPYVAGSDFLPTEISAFEPSKALFAEEDGLAVIRRLLLEAPGFLAPHGAMVIEIGDGQALAVQSLAEASGWTAYPFQDMHGHVRGLRLARP